MGRLEGFALNMAALLSDVAYCFGIRLERLDSYVRRRVHGR